MITLICLLVVNTKADEWIRRLKNMKSYKNLWNNFISDENIDLAIKESTRGKKKRKRQVKNFIKRLPDSKKDIIEYANNFHNDVHNPKIIYDGVTRKKRLIYPPTCREQIIHNMLVNVLKPIILKGMYEHSYGSIPGLGPHKGKKIIEKWIKEDIDNCKYVLKMDIKKYFDSIPHTIYLSKIRKVIKDDKVYSIIEEITKVKEKGIALGFYPSQWTANWYLQDLDHFIKEKLCAKHYIRYMDDMVIFDSSSYRLHFMQSEIERYLNLNLGLEMNKNWQVFKFDYMGCYDNHYGRPLDFMGFKFYCNKTTLRKSILLKATRKSRMIKKKGSTVHSARQMLSYLGWIDCTNTYDYYKEHIKKHVVFRRLKKTISRHQIKMNKEESSNGME